MDKDIDVDMNDCFQDRFHIQVTQSPVHYYHIEGRLLLSTVQIYEKLGMSNLDVYHTDLDQWLLEGTRSGHNHPILTWLQPSLNNSTLV